ncbi:hypothetical protein OXX69_000973 [Metschnikowia pulcherrima]
MSQTVNDALCVWAAIQSGADSDEDAHTEDEASLVDYHYGSSDDEWSDVDSEDESSTLDTTRKRKTYDGFDEAARNTFTAYMLTESVSTRVMSKETYAEYCNVLKETRDDPLPKPAGLDRAQTIKFHLKRTKIRSNYELLEGQLYFKAASGARKMVATHSNAFDIIAELHQKTHAKKIELCKLVSSKSRGIHEEDVATLFKMCTICSNGAGKYRLPDLLDYPEKDTKEVPFDRLQIDFIDQRHAPSRGFKWILSIRDHLSNHAILFPLTERLPSMIAECLGRFCRYYGFPLIIQYDDDTVISAAIAQFVCWHGFQFRKGRIRSLDTELAASEFICRVKLTILEWKKAYQSDHWDESIFVVERTLNRESYTHLQEFNPYRVIFGATRAEKIQEIQRGMLVPDKALDVCPVNLRSATQRHTWNRIPVVNPACVSSLLESLSLESSDHSDPFPSTSSLLLREEAFIKHLASIQEHQVVVRDQMARKYAYNHQIHEFAKGDFCTVKLPREVRSGLDDKRFYAEVIEVFDENVKRYTVLSKWGVLNKRMVTQEMNPVPKEMWPAAKAYLADALRLETVTMNLIGTRNTSSELRPVFCTCKGKCVTNHCSCFKAGLKCTQYCDHECENKGTIAQNTVMGMAYMENTAS